MNCICGSCFAESVEESGICTACGYDGAKNKQDFPLALPAGSILYGRYIVGKVLGQGGFGITYIAQDYMTKELVAIKEFFPDTMATRTNATTVTPFTGERGENFNYGKISFLDEAKTMAEFNDNPNVAGVRLYFDENGTAYFVMEYVDGASFEEYIKQHGGRISWDETMQVILPVLDALDAVHKKGIIHRDVTPDNIFITKDGTVKLLDFGAARYSLGNVSRSLDVILKHGFAPKEQYTRHGRQGPYTDVYSVSATIYYALTGAKPDDAIERADEDTLPLPSTLGAKLTRQQEDVLLKGLAIKAEDRYQTATELRDALTVKSGRKTDDKKEDTKRASGETPVTGQKRVLPKWLIPVGAVVVVLIMGIVFSSRSANSTDGSAPTGNYAIPEGAVAAGGSDAVWFSTSTGDAVMMAVDCITDENQDFLTNEELDAQSEEYGKLPFWGQTKYARNQVTTICFLNSKSGAPYDAWDVSQGQNGSVLAWMEDGNLTVAADGKIVLNENSAYLFSYFINVSQIDFGSNVDTSGVTSMGYMFEFCKKLTGLDLSCFDTAKVTDMSGMFVDCHNLTSLDLSGFDTSCVTTMGGMFGGCFNLSNLDLTGFDTSRVQNMAFMFSFCESLTSLDLSGFDTSSLTYMSGMFQCCMNLTSLDLSGFDTSSVWSSDMLFAACDMLTDLICTDALILEEWYYA